MHSPPKGCVRSMLDWMAQDYERGGGGRISTKQKTLSAALAKAGWEGLIARMDAYRGFWWLEDEMTFEDAVFFARHTQMLLGRCRTDIPDLSYALIWLMAGMPWPAANRLTVESRRVISSELFTHDGKLTSKALDVPIDMILELAGDGFLIMDESADQPEDPLDPLTN